MGDVSTPEAAISGKGLFSMESFFQCGRPAYIGPVLIFVLQASDNALKSGFSPHQPAVAKREWNLKWLLNQAMPGTTHALTRLRGPTP